MFPMVVSEVYNPPKFKGLCELSVIQGASQWRLDHLGWIFHWLAIFWHLVLCLWDLKWKHFCNLFQCRLVSRLCIELSCCVEVGGIAGQYGIWWPMWWKVVVMTCGSSALCLTRLFTSPFPTIFEYAPTFLMASMLRATRSWFRWLYWEEGYLMWFSKSYILLTMLVKMKVSVVSFFGMFYS